jgi:hypothetical protein
LGREIANDKELQEIFLKDQGFKIPNTVYFNKKKVKKISCS